MRFGRRTLAELGEGEWMLESITRGYLALAEWLHGELDRGRTGACRRSSPVPGRGRA